MTVVMMALREETKPSGSNGPFKHQPGGVQIHCHRIEERERELESYRPPGASSGGWHLPGLHVEQAASRWKVTSFCEGAPPLEGKYLDRYQ